MAFFALVESHTGEIIDVVTSLDEALPPGVMAIELPGRFDDVRAWLRARSKNTGGGGAGEAFVDGDDDGQQHGGPPRNPEYRDAEAFFARLDNEAMRADLGGRQFVVVLFDLAPVDWPLATEFATEALRAHGQELLPCDVVARLREHLAGVLLPDIEAEGMNIEPERGRTAVLGYPRDREAIDVLRRRKHPWLRPPAYRRAS